MSRTAPSSELIVTTTRDVIIAGNLVAQHTIAQVRGTDAWYIISRSFLILEGTGEEEVMIFHSDPGGRIIPGQGEVGERSFESVEEALCWLAELVAA